METTLHRELKAIYAGRGAACEVRVDGFRIDAVSRGRLIEIQQSPLGAISRKVQKLLETHSVLVVKPLFANKCLVRRDPETGAILSSRQSPQHATKWDLFLEMVRFAHVFPHPRLTLELLLVDIEEDRIDRPRRRWKGKSHQVLDRRLTHIGERLTLKTAADLRRWLPDHLPAEFTTHELAAAAGVPRWWAQKIAYCLRSTGALVTLGKRERSWLYGIPRRRAAA